MHRLARCAALVKTGLPTTSRSPRLAVARAAMTVAAEPTPPPAPAAAAPAPPPDPRFAGPPQPGESVLIAAQRILRAASPEEKASYCESAWALFQAGRLTLPPSAGGPPLPPDLPPAPAKPARDGRVTVLPPQKVKRLKQGGTVESRAAILHALAHIESWAVDVFADVIARWGGDPAYRLPAAFFEDFLRGAAEEASHFRSLERRLIDTGFSYGSFAAHDGLWESAAGTAGSLPARLAVEHCVHEARGLDTLPATIAKFERAGDLESVAVLRDVIYPEEVTHCAAGVRWLTWLHGVAVGGPGAPPDAVAAAAGAAWAAEARGHPSPQAWFHALVRSSFRGSLKPPFNDEARARAGFTEEWYLPLATPPGGAGVAGAPGSRAGPKE
jgi:uncharacterized ferritin-like protein (DUF455 family)